MSVTKIEIKNIRNITNLKIGFTSNSRSVVLSGNNCTGKSTILRFIVIGISDSNTTTTAFREIPREFVCKGSDFGEITVDLV